MDTLDDWDGIESKGKINYIFFRVILKKMIPLGFVLYFIFSFFNFLNKGLEIISYKILFELLFVLISFSLIGVLIGFLNWDLNENIDTKEKSEIKFKFILINGILTWAVPLFIADFITRDEISVVFFFVYLIVWITVGYFFGSFLFKDFEENI
ncbi:MAG: hypothetical protein ACOCRX_11100 [Candidatus Woesearchaeota archaeon]